MEFKYEWREKKFMRQIVQTVLDNEGIQVIAPPIGKEVK